jgi:hypothetical protein
MRPDPASLSRGERLMAGGAVAFSIVLFFVNWYGVSSNVGAALGVNVNVSRSGWDTFLNSRWVWLATILAALGAVALPRLGPRIELPVPAAAIVAGLGALSVLLIGYRIRHHPSASLSAGAFHASAGIRSGIWLGLAAAATTTWGAVDTLRSDGPGRTGT